VDLIGTLVKEVARMEGFQRVPFDLILNFALKDVGEDGPVV
jgi:hypothetical protein